MTDSGTAFDAVSTHKIIDHLASETGRVECNVLCLPYQHLSPLVSPGRFTHRGVEEGAEQEAEWHARPQPPAPDTDDDAATRCARDWQRLVDARKPLSLQ